MQESEGTLKLPGEQNKIKTSLNMSSISLMDENGENDFDYQTGIQDDVTEGEDARSSSDSSVGFGSNLLDISADSSLEQRKRELELE